MQLLLIFSVTFYFINRGLEYIYIYELYHLFLNYIKLQFTNGTVIPFWLIAS